MRASMRGYRKSLVHGRVGKLEKMSRGVFDLQDALLQLKVMELEEEQEFRVTAGPAEPAPKRTAARTPSAPSPDAAGRHDGS